LPFGDWYARGLQRGFDGPNTVPDAEHRDLLERPDRDVVSAYMKGVLQGSNLRAAEQLGFKE
jgi:hypothetical protein